MEPGNIVLDEYKRRHQLVECLGRGGQGEVWSTASGRHVVKIRHARAGAEDVRRQFLRIKRANLENICVAKPIALLAPPQTGYVAEYLEGMQPFRALLRPPAGEDAVAWHLATGSLRRRLRLLAHLGESMVALHASGFAYGDLSHGNAFVSADPAAHEAWLIDLDNLTTSNDPSKAVYTPGYGAPEIVAGHSGTTSYSDAWSFAVLAHQVLTKAHPFLGDAVQAGDPEREEAAFAGHLPWVDDPKDRSNASTQGLPRTAVVSPRLQTMFEQCFGTGRRDFHARPGIGAWVDALHLAADFTVECSGCSGTFYVTNARCPWCSEARPTAWTCGFRRWHPSRLDPEAKTPSNGPGLLQPMQPSERSYEVHRAEWLRLGGAILSGARIELTRRHTHGDVGHAARTVTLVLRPAPGGARFEAPSNDAPSYLQQDDGNLVPLPPTGALLTLDRSKGLLLRGRPAWIHFGPPDQPHRVMTIGAPQ
jgi:serine/threonine protein kinase